MLVIAATTVGESDTEQLPAPYRPAVVPIASGLSAVVSAKFQSAPHPASRCSVLFGDLDVTNLRSPCRGSQP